MKKIFFILLSLISITSFAQEFGTFKQLRLRNNTDSTSAAAVTNGTVFYNTTSNKFRFRQNGAWTSFVTSSGSGAITASNGLTKTGNNIALGGALTGNTSITGDFRLTLGGGATNAGLNLNTSFGNPTNPVDGDIWIHSTSKFLNLRLDGSTRNILNAATGTLGTNYIPFNTGIQSALVTGTNNFTFDPTNIALIINNANQLRIHARGTQNTFVGKNSGNFTLTGSFNTFLGAETGLDLTTGSNNTMVGYAAGDVLLSGSNNTYVGFAAGQTATISNNSTIIGYQSATSGSSSESTIIGAQAGNNAGTNNVIIGRLADVTASGTGYMSIQNIIYGINNNGTSITPSTGNIGIGISIPTSRLHLPAGATSATTAPLKFTSGPLLTTAEAGAVEFLTDKWYATITTGAARKEFVLGDITLTSTHIPFATTNGRLTDEAALAYNSTTNTLTADNITSNSAGIFLIQSSGSATVNIKTGGDALIETPNATGIQSLKASTNTIFRPLKIDTQTTGTPAIGIGTGMQFITETGTGTGYNAAFIDAVSTDVTTTSEDFDLIFSNSTAGAAPTEKLRIESSGAVRFNPIVGNPSTTVNGNMWVNSSTNRFMVKQNNTNYPVIIGNISAGEITYANSAADGDIASNTNFRIATGTNYGLSIGQIPQNLEALNVHQGTGGSPTYRYSYGTAGDDPSVLTYQERTVTANATVTTIKTIAIPASTTVAFEYHVYARRTGGTAGTAEDGAYYVDYVTYKNVAGTATVLGAATRAHLAESQAGWDVDSAPSGGNVIFRVTGATNNNITWHIEIKMRQVGN